MTASFLTLPVPAGNGVGAARNVEGIGYQKTVVVDGAFDGVVILEAAAVAGGPFVELFQSDKPRVLRTQVAAAEVRVRLRGFKSGSVAVGLSAAPGHTGSASLPVPAGNGLGGAVDVSALGAQKSIYVTGLQTSVLRVAISSDGVNFEDVLTADQNGIFNFSEGAQFMRVRQVGWKAGTPSVAVAGSAGGPSGAQSAAMTAEILPLPQVVTWYVRPTGDDENDGTTPATAFATLTRAFRQIRTNVVNLMQVIDVTGMKGASAITKDDGPMEFPVVLAGQSNGLSTTVPNAGGPNNFSGLELMQLRAEMDLIQSITVNSISHDAVTNLTVVNVTESLGTGSHVGRQLIGTGFFEHATIADTVENAGGDTDIFLASSQDSFSSPAIYEYGAEIRAGDASNSFEKNGSHIVTGPTSWKVTGVKFSATNDAQQGLTVRGPSSIQLVQCDVVGLSYAGVGVTGGGGGWDACYIHGVVGGASKFLGVQGSNQNGLQLRHSYYENLTIGFDTPWVIFLGAWFEAPQDPVTRNHSTMMHLGLEEFEIRNAAREGVRGRGTHFVNLNKGRISNSGQDAIELVGGGRRHSIANVVGSGNGGFGCRMSQGAQLAVGAGVSVTGASGDVDLGGAGAVTWGSAPNTDVAAAVPEFCGIY